MQISGEPVVLSKMIIDCDNEMGKSHGLISNMLIAGRSDKLAVLTAFASFEFNYHCCCDIAERAVAFAIHADTGATQEERNGLRKQVACIQRRWSEMLWHIEEGIKLFGIVQHESGMMH